MYLRKKGEKGGGRIGNRERVLYINKTKKDAIEEDPNLLKSERATDHEP